MKQNVFTYLINYINWGGIAIFTSLILGSLILFVAIIWSITYFLTKRKDKKNKTLVPKQAPEQKQILNQPQKTAVVQTQQSSSNSSASNQQKESSGCGFVAISFIVFSIIAICIICFISYMDNKPSTPSNNNGSGSGSNNEIIFPIKKEPPTVDLEQTLTGLIFNIHCNDNYSYVILRVELLDKNYNVTKSFTIREDTLKKGETRQAEYKFSLGEFFNSNSVRARLEDYK